MKLRSLALNHFKMFDSPVRLDGIRDGVNVVAGRNELGKSTLLSALRAVLFENSGSTATAIRELQNVNDPQGPVIQLDFELDKGEYRIEKRFIKRAYARLTCPDGSVLTSDAAEEELRKLLVFDRAGPRGATTDSLGMWNVLWVQQGKSFGAVDMTERARNSLHGALKSEVGDVLGGRKGRQLQNQFEKELHALITEGRGDPRNEYKDARQKVESAKEALAACNENRQKFYELFDSLEVAQESIRRLEQDMDRQEDQNELSEVEARIHAYERVAQRLETEEVELEKKRLLRDKAKSDLDAFRDLKAGIKSKKRECESIQQVLKEVQDKADRSASRIAERHEQLTLAKRRLNGAEKSESRARRILRAAEISSEIESLQGKMEKVSAAEQEMRKMQAELDDIAMTKEAIEQIRNADRVARDGVAKLEAVATSVEFDIAPERLEGIQVDGRQVPPEELQMRISEPAIITIPDRGRITVRPGAQDIVATRLQVQRSQDDLAALLEKHGASSPSEAEAKHERRQNLLNHIALKRKEISLHLPNAEDDAASADGLAQSIVSNKEELDRMAVRLESLETMDISDAKSSYASACEELDLARKTHSEAQDALDAAESSISGMQAGLATNKENYRHALADLDRMKERLRQMKSESSGKQRQKNHDDAFAELDDQTERFSRLKKEVTDSDISMMRASAKRIAKSIRQRQEHLSKQKGIERELLVRIEENEGSGFDQKIEELEGEFENSQIICDRFEHEVKVLKELVTVLSEAEKSATQKYLSPVVNQVTPYMNHLFSNVSDFSDFRLELDDELRLVSVTKKPGPPEQFRSLSLGTQEQVAILIRLGFAKLLVEQGRPATVILDDALVFSDDKRIQRMFDILEDASEHVQIIILTCREQLFERLGGHRLELKPAEVSDFQQA